MKSIIDRLTESPKPTPVDALVKDQRPASPMSKAPPPKTTIGQLIVKDQKPLPPPAVSRCPVVPIQHHLPKHEIKQRRSPEDDGIEVRAEVHADSGNEPPNGTPSSESIAPQKPKEPSPPPPPPPLPSLLRQEEPKDCAKEDIKEEPKEVAKEDNKQVLKGPLDPDDLRSLMMEELKKNKVSVEEMIVLKGMEQRRGDKAFSPSKELLEMIHRENG
ncbi:hypothetical protein ANCDUO_15570, partial [Ancylostoma duodenale]